jgi:Uma2 family endonuclease
MGELAISRMTVDQFLDWEDGTDTRYELVDGQPVAMASGTPEHGELIARVSRLVGSRLQDPCRVVNTTAIRRAEDHWRSYVPDVLVTCEPRQQGKKAIESPRLIVEVLSPSTASNDHGDKFDFYRAIPSVEEILFVASTTRRIEVWRRENGEWRAQLLGRGAMLRLAACDTPIPVDEVYGNVVD